MIDTTRNTDIRYSHGRMLRTVLPGAILIVISGAIAFGPISAAAGGPYLRMIGYFGLALFGSFAVMPIWLALTRRGPVVTLTPEGILDKRIGDKIIPWQGIQEISTFAINRLNIVILRLTPDAEMSLPLSKSARRAIDLNRSIGADGLGVSAVGLELSFEQLRSAATAYLEAARANDETSTSNHSG